MNTNTLIGILIPFIGTTAGAACVIFMKNDIKPLLQKILLGFASGVMVAAGIGFLLLMDRIIPHLHIDNGAPEGVKSSLSRTTMLVLAVTLHNIPEGMAVGVVFAGAMSGNSNITLAGALALSIGIAIQNFPEGAIISMPLKSEGKSRGRSFILGMLSGIVEPIGALLTILLASLIVPVLPYLLAFAAGAMIYVVVEELIPEASQGEHSNIATIGFAAGFIVMMILDVALG